MFWWLHANPSEIGLDCDVYDRGDRFSKALVTFWARNQILNKKIKAHVLANKPVHFVVSTDAEHNIAYISQQFCTNRFIFSKWTSLILFFFFWIYKPGS